MTDMISNCT